jgi:gliding motility-associated-like protein
MNIKFTIIGMLCICCAQLCTAQKENNIWVFGGGIGLDFNTTAPTLIKSSISSVEGSATIADTNGNLLFYSNGISVWDRSHNLMPNGTGLLGAIYQSSTQGVAIVPVASSPNLYFLFCVDELADVPRPAYLRYSLIDMSLNGGNGDIVVGKKNIIIDSNMSEKMIVAPTCNGVWLINHHIDSSIFYARKIDRASSIPKPVISKTTGLNDYSRYSVGEIKFSSDYKQIALCNYVFPLHYTNSKVECFDFDAITGKISGYRDFGILNTAYSVEFSPDNSKLYVLDYSGSVFQYNLGLLPSMPSVLSSKYELSRSGYLSMRRAVDGKIYLRPGYTETNISCINKPNLAGALSDIQDSIPSLVNSNTEYFLQFGNSTTMPIQNKVSKQTILLDTTICQGNSVTCIANPIYNFILWNDGDTATKKILTDSGINWRKSTLNCTTIVDSFKIKFKSIDSSFAKIDTVLCFQQNANILLPQNFKSYLWNDGTTAAQSTFTKSGVKWRYASNNDCTMRVDTISAKFIDFSINLQDTSICKSEKIVLDATTANASQYLWQDNSTQNTFTAYQTGKYWVRVSVDKCTKTDTIIINEKEFNLNLGTDKSVCNDDSLVLGSNITNVSYLWHDGTTNASFTVKNSGTYSLTVRQGVCVSSDTISIKFYQCEKCIAIPNAFTPNNDNKNDLFKPIFNCPTLTYQLLIVNRYGQEIFKTNNVLDAWNGLVNNQEQELGVYYYLIKVKFDSLQVHDCIFFHWEQVLN